MTRAGLDSWKARVIWVVAANAQNSDCSEFRSKHNTSQVNP